MLSGQGAEMDTTAASGKLVFGIFAALAEFERECTIAGLAANRARGRKGGCRFALTKAQVRLAQAAMGKKETQVREMREELGVIRVNRCRYVSPDGTLRDHGRRRLKV